MNPTSLPYSVRVNAAASYPCARDWTWDSPHLLDYDLWYAASGRGSLSVQGEGVTYEVRGSDCFLLKPGACYIGRHDPDTPLHVLAVHFDFLDPQGRTIAAPLPFPLHRRVADHPFFSGLLLRCIQASQEGLKNEAAQWLAMGLKEMATMDEQGRIPGRVAAHYAARIEGMCARVHAAPNERFEVASLARELNVSKDHFTRLFKQAKGCSPQEFIVRQRIEYAKYLLLSSTYTVSEIAEIAGYRDIFYFCRQFKEKTGTPPATFRRMRNEIDTHESRGRQTPPPTTRG